MKLRRTLTYLIPLLILALLVISFGRRKKPFEQTFISMDTAVRVKFEGNDQTSFSSLADSVKRIFDYTDSIFNTYDSTSTVFAMNNFQNSGEGDTFFFSGDSFFSALMDSALTYRDMTEGAFHPAVAPVTFLWKIMAISPRIPPDDSVELALTRSALGDSVFIRSDTVFFKKGANFDLGGIAKGFALGLAEKMLARHSGNGENFSFLIDAGRSITGMRKKPFKLGITHPRMENSVYGSFTLPSGWFCATSGDYERFFIKDGVRYHHIFDPKTGRPSHSSVSVTVAGKSATGCDALSTALFVMGPERGLEFLKKHTDFEAIIIYEENSQLKHVLSNGFRDKLNFKQISNQS